MIRAANVSSHREIRYLLSAFLPPLLIAALFAVGLAVDDRAQYEVDRMVNALTPETRPSLGVVQNFSYSDHFFGAPEALDSDDWSRLSLAAAEINTRVDRFTRSFDGSRSDALFPSSEDWPVAAVLEQILTDASPILQKIKNSANDPEGRIRVGDPIVRLLMHRIRLAVYQDDPAAALEHLQAIHHVTQRSRCSCHEAKFALRTLYSAINESLAIGFWQTPEFVARLQEWVDEPLPIKSAGLKQLQEGYSGTVATIDRDRRHQNALGRWEVHTPNRFYVYLLTDYWDEMKQAWEANPLQIHQLLDDSQTRGWSDLTIVGMPNADRREYRSVGSPWRVRNHLTELAETEYQRLITSALVAIKQYHLEAGKWPRNLNELTTDGRWWRLWHPEIERTLQLLPTSNGDHAVLRRPRDLVLAISPNLDTITSSGAHYAWFEEDMVK